MFLNDYLNSDEHKRRILIVSDISRGNTIIRAFENRTGKLVRNVNCMNLSLMVDQLYLYICAKKGIAKEHRILEEQEAMMLFRSIILNNISSLKYFKNEKLMDLATTNELFSKINLVRANGWNGKEPEIDRIDDLKAMISWYENKLESDKCMDQIAKERYVLDNIKSDEIDLAFSAEISYLVEDMMYLSGLEEQILTLLKNAADPKIILFDDQVTVESLKKNCKRRGCKTAFYRGYGSFNEASYIANDILEKKHQLGSVTVLYASSNQLPAISAALRGNGLKMNVISNHTVTDNRFISLAKSILAWAYDDYSERMLEGILSNPVLCIEKTYEVPAPTASDPNATETKKDNILAHQSYFDHVLNARNRFGDDAFSLGWGYKRNEEFLEHERRIISDSEMNKVFDMHQRLLEIFSNAGIPYDDKNCVRPIDIWERIVEFINDYRAQSVDYELWGGIVESISNIVVMEERTLPLGEALAFIDELLSGIKTSDEDDDTTISVVSIGDWRYLERPNVYVVGLSLKDMLGNTTESPVLFDKEMEEYLVRGYTPTINKDSDRRRRNMINTLKTFNGKNIAFGYSDYDTVNFCENNASIIFRETLAALDGRTINELPEFVYGNPVQGISSIPSKKCKNKASYKVSLKTSSSKLEDLLDCPKEYAYKHELKIPEDEFEECSYEGWLDARVKGSFFHDLIATCCNTILCRLPDGSYSTVIDEDAIKAHAAKLKIKYLMQKPCAFQKLADTDADEIVNATIGYVYELINDLNTNGWRVLFSEKYFVNAEFDVVPYHQRKKIKFITSGYVDRIDYRLDIKTKTCYVRIADYKTGQQKYKEADDEQGKLIQYLIYENAVMKNGFFKEIDSSGQIVEIKALDVIRDEVARLEKDNAIKKYKFKFDGFKYIFPFDNNAREYDPNPSDGQAALNMIRLKSILTIIEKKHIYPDRKQLIEKLAELEVQYPSSADEISQLRGVLEKNKKAQCDYCNYHQLCINRKAGEIK